MTNYPQNPNVGDEFDTGTVTFMWDGVKWKAVTVGGRTIISYANTESMQNSRPTQTGQRVENRERANAQYSLSETGYSAQPGDIVAANGRVWALVKTAPLIPEHFGAKGDGDKDDTQAASDAHSFGLPVVYNNTYVLDGFISVSDKPFIMQGKGTILFNTPYVGDTHKFELERCEVSVEGVTFDLNSNIDNLFSLRDCTLKGLRNNTFKNSSSVSTTTGLKHIIRLERTPSAKIQGNTFERIGDVGGGSLEVDGQYRCIGANTGCGDHLISGNTFTDCFQPLVCGEFEDWSNDNVTYTVGDRVIFLVGGGLLTGGQWNQYRCIQDHQDGLITPENGTYWSLEHSDITPTRSGSYSCNINRMIWDNAVYITGPANDSYTITGNHWIDCRDEPIVIVGGNVTVAGNTFYNIENKAIALDTRFNDLGAITVSGNTFSNVDGSFNGNFIAERDVNTGYTIKALSIVGNTFSNAQSLSNASAILIDSVDSLVITGNSADLQIGNQEIFIRVSGAVQSGTIHSNTLVCPDDRANFVLFDSPSDVDVEIGFNSTNARYLLTSPNVKTSSGYIQDTGSNIYIKQPISRTLHGNAAPTNGEWVRGDRILHQFPTSNGFEGWVCVASGTPGTWKEFGTIEA